MTLKKKKYVIPKEPVKAYKNIPFLTSPAARSLRIQCEMTEPYERLKQFNINNTIVFFGSARNPAPEDAKTPQGKRLAKYYSAAVDLSKSLTQWSMKLPKKDRFYICSGGGPGIMEAANRGAHEAGGESLGLGISLPFEQTNNPYISDKLSFEFHYFFTRKYWFLYEAKAVVIFPGGFGTLDETFEMLTLIQTEKIKKKMPIVLYGSEFWNKLINFDVMVELGTISPEDLKLFKIMDDLKEIKTYLTRELRKHYL